MHERERESAHARLTRGEQTRELGKEAPGGKNERRRLAHLGRQLELGAEALGRREKLARLGRSPERLVELIEQSLPAAHSEAFARQRRQLADAVDADGGEKRFVGADR